MRDSSESIPNSPEGNLNLPKEADFPLEHFGSSDGSKPGFPRFPPVRDLQVKNKFPPAIPGDPEPSPAAAISSWPKGNSRNRNVKMGLTQDWRSCPAPVLQAD